MGIHTAEAMRTMNQLPGQVQTAGSGRVKPTQLFNKRWDRYKRGTKLVDNDVLDQLWACMSDSLERAAHNDGADTEETEVSLMARIKKLAVKQTNVLVNQVKFLSMGQDRDEPVSSFVARLRGQVNTCDFSVKCGGCQATVSYMEHIMAHQLVHALSDEEIQRKVLAQAAAKTEMSLEESIGTVKAQEMGKRDQGIISNSASLNRVTEYKSGANLTKLNKNTNQVTLSSPGSGTPSDRCTHCGRKYHSSSKEARKASCRAFELVCRKCNIKGHLAHCCKSKIAAQTGSQPDPPQTTENPAAVSSLVGQVGNCFAVFSRQSRPDPGDDDWLPAASPRWYKRAARRVCNQVANHSRLQDRTKTLSVPHFSCKDGVWAQRPVEPHPLIKDVQVQICKEGYLAVLRPVPLKT